MTETTLSRRCLNRALLARHLLLIPGSDDETAMVEAAARTRVALADGRKSVKELDGLVTGFLRNAGFWIDLVRVPPSGTWERRGADRRGRIEIQEYEPIAGRERDAVKEERAALEVFHA